MDYYAPKLLNPDHHARLVEGLATFCTTAGIPPRFVYAVSAKDFCSEREINFIKKYPAILRGEVPYMGAILCGEEVDTNNKFMAITGSFVRNYIDARMQSVRSIVDGMKGGTKYAERGSIVLVPDFYLPRNTKSASMTDGEQYDSQLLLSWMQIRLSMSKPVVLYISDFNDFKSRWGLSFANLIQQNLVDITENVDHG